MFIGKISINEVKRFPPGCGIICKKVHGCEVTPRLLLFNRRGIVTVQMCSGKNTNKLGARSIVLRSVAPVSDLVVGVHYSSDS